MPACLLQVTGSGFLYKQVRHMTGALLALGEGRIALQDMASRLEVGNTQPPGAGFIHSVYPRSKVNIWPCMVRC